MAFSIRKYVLMSGVSVNPGLSLSLCHLTLCFYLCTECLVVPHLCFYRFLHETLFVSSWFPTCASITFRMRHSLSHFGSLSFSSGQRRNVLSTSDVQYGIPILRQRKIRNGLKKKRAIMQPPTIIYTNSNFQQIEPNFYYFFLFLI